MLTLATAGHRAETVHKHPPLLILPLSGAACQLTISGDTSLTENLRVKHRVDFEIIGLGGLGCPQLRQYTEGRDVCNAARTRCTRPEIGPGITCARRVQRLLHMFATCAKRANMTKNSENCSDKGLANLRPWKPGQSGNPAGRKRGSVSITSAIKRVLSEPLPKDEKRRLVDLFAADLVEAARKGNGTAIREILARIDGPIATVHEGGDPDKPIRVVTDAKQRLTSLLAGIAARTAMEKQLPPPGERR